MKVDDSSRGLPGSTHHLQGTGGGQQYRLTPELPSLVICDAAEDEERPAPPKPPTKNEAGSWLWERRGAADACKGWCCVCDDSCCCEVCWPPPPLRFDSEEAETWRDTTGRGWLLFVSGGSWCGRIHIMKTGGRGARGSRLISSESRGVKLLSGRTQC